LPEKEVKIHLDYLPEQVYSIAIMNRLATDKRTAVIAALVEGTSINATCRITGVAKHTVLKLLKDLGCACASYHDSNVRNLRVRRVQCDEIWAFVYAKQKNVTAEQMEQGAVSAKNGEPRSHGCAVFHALQLLPGTQDAQGDPSDGGWPYRSRLDY
jgi:hypothetical protein